MNTSKHIVMVLNVQHQIVKAIFIPMACLNFFFVDADVLSFSGKYLKYFGDCISLHEASKYQKRKIIMHSPYQRKSSLFC